MKRHWLTLEAMIGVAATCMVVYMMSLILELRLECILGFYIASTLSTLWMAYRILTEPYTTNKTFDEYFYEDREDIRRYGTE